MRYIEPRLSEVAAIANDLKCRVTMIICESCIALIQRCIESDLLQPNVLFGKEVAVKSPVCPLYSSKITEGTGTKVNQPPTKEFYPKSSTRNAFKPNKPHEKVKSRVSLRTNSSRHLKRLHKSESITSIDWTDEEMAALMKVLELPRYKGSRGVCSITPHQLEDLFLCTPFCVLSKHSTESVLAKIEEMRRSGSLERRDRKQRNRT